MQRPNRAMEIYHASYCYIRNSSCARSRSLLFEKTVDTTATDASIKSSSELLTLTSPGVKPMEISNGAAKRIAKAAALSNSGKRHAI